MTSPAIDFDAIHDATCDEFSKAEIALADYMPGLPNLASKQLKPTQRRSVWRTVIAWATGAAATMILITDGIAYSGSAYADAPSTGSPAPLHPIPAHIQPMQAPVIHTTAPTVAARSFQAEPIASAYEDQAAIRAWTTSVGVGTTSGSLVGTGLGAVTGCIIGGAVGTPALIPGWIGGCIAGGIAGAGVGGVIGTVATGGITALVAAAPLVQTLTAAPGTSPYAQAAGLR